MNLGREPRCPCSCASILGIRALWSIFDPRSTRTTILATSRRTDGRGRRGIQEARHPYRAPDAHRVVRRRAPAGLVPALERPDGPRRRVRPHRRDRHTQRLREHGPDCEMTGRRDRRDGDVGEGRRGGPGPRAVDPTGIPETVCRTGREAEIRVSLVKLPPAAALDRLADCGRPDA